MAENDENIKKESSRIQKGVIKKNVHLKCKHGALFVCKGKAKPLDEMLTVYKEPEDLVTQKQIAEQTVIEAEEKTKKQKSKKSKILSLIFFIVNIAIIAVIIITQSIKDDSMASIGDMFAVANFWYLLGAFGCFLLLMATDTFRWWMLILRSTKHSRPFLSYKTMALGRYYDNITPLATGGQPFQIYYMAKRGIKGSTASSIPFAIYIFNQIVAVCVSLCVLIFSKKIAGGLDPTVFTAAVVGVVLNTTIMAFVLLLSVSKKIGPTLTIWILKLLHKMHIIKDYTALFRKVMRFVSEYQKTFRYFMSNFFVMIPMLLTSFLNTVVKFMIPACVVCMFNNGHFDWATYSAVFIWCTLIDAVLSYIPWPGAAGVAEISYVTMFAYFSLTTGTVVWAMLIYRIFQYYIYLIQGLLVLAYDFLFGNKKIEKTKARLAHIDAERAKNASK